MVTGLTQDGCEDMAEQGAAPVPWKALEGLPWPLPHSTQGVVAGCGAVSRGRQEGKAGLETGWAGSSCRLQSLQADSQPTGPPVGAQGPLGQWESGRTWVEGELCRLPSESTGRRAQSWNSAPSHRHVEVSAQF